MTTFDEKVQQGLALESAVRTSKETDTPCEIAGVMIYPCDTYGRISPAYDVRYKDEPVPEPIHVSTQFDTSDLPRNKQSGPAKHDLDPSLVSRLHDLQDDFGARGVVLAAQKLWPDAEIQAWDDERRGVRPHFEIKEDGRIFKGDEEIEPVSTTVVHTTTASETPFGTAFVTTEKPRFRLYTAGCISGDDRPFEEKAAVFYEGRASLEDKGYDVTNPLDVDNAFCQHGKDTCHENTLRRLKGKDQGAGHSWECYMRNDLIALLQCDGVALLPGWEQSPGARWEFDTATRVGLPAKPIEEWLDARQTFVGVDPAGDGAIVTGYMEDGKIHVLRVDTESVRDAAAMTTDTNGHDYCARCKTSKGSHAPGGSRYGCTYAGPGTPDVCTICAEKIVWSGLRWEATKDTGHKGFLHMCEFSTQPDVAHEPQGTGEQR